MSDFKPNNEYYSDPSRWELPCPQCGAEWSKVKCDFCEEHNADGAHDLRSDEYTKYGGDYYER